jgi:hypothetical protein
MQLPDTCIPFSSSTENVLTFRPDLKHFPLESIHLSLTGGTMKIYIAASWKHQHAVEMLTALLEDAGHAVLSWLREGRPEEAFLSRRELEHFIYSVEGKRVFDFCAGSAIGCDLVIYLGPSGCDAWAEVGAAYGRGVPVLGLLAKSEEVGLMRHMIRSWHRSVNDLLQAVERIAGLRPELFASGGSA